MSLSDVDECAVSNGGCSHKCVNTAGGYKCECPDPELSLSWDNKTCQGKHTLYIISFSRVQCILFLISVSLHYIKLVSKLKRNTNYNSYPLAHDFRKAICSPLLKDALVSNFSIDTDRKFFLYSLYILYI